MDPELDALRQAGLTDYQARAYIALLSLGDAEASEVAEASDVPRTRVYDVLDDLETHGWITSEPGRPRTYRPLDPRASLQSVRERFEDAIEEALPRLEARYTEREQRFAGSLWVLEGDQAVLERRREMIENAREWILLLVSNLNWRIDDLIPLLSRAHRRGVRARLAAAHLDDEQRDQLERAGVEVHTAPSPVQALVIDGSQALLVFFRPAGEDPGVRGVWNPNAEFVSLMSEALPYTLGMRPPGPEDAPPPGNP